MGCYNFVQEIKPDYYCNDKESVFGSLYKEYERVIFRSIITTFGLDMIIKDVYGGDVDTIHNVRQISDDGTMFYKNPKNLENYDNKGEYSHKDVEGKDTNFQRIKHEARDKYHENTNNTVNDAYEDKQLGFLGKSKGHPTDKSAELDHVIAAKSIFEDRGRVLSGLSTVDLADAEDNLKWTNEHLNKSMGADEIPDYIEKHPELPDDVKKRMMDAYNQAKNAYEDRINRAYYYDFSNPQCKQFYKDCFKSAGKRGLQMGLRQSLGFLFTELWLSIREQIINNDKGDLKSILITIKEGVSKWYKDVKEKYKEIFEKFGDGLIGGFVASLSTTFINTFNTTSINIGKIIRQIWASITEAMSILFFNSRGTYFCDRITSAAKVIATGASTIVGTSVQETIYIKLTEIAIPQALKNTVSEFCGVLISGLLSVSLLFYIDNDPFRTIIGEIYRKNELKLQYQGKLFVEYCAKLQNFDLNKFELDTEYAYNLSVMLQNAENSESLTTILRKALIELKIELPWGSGSLDDKMKDKDWVLKIHC